MKLSKRTINIYLLCTFMFMFFSENQRLYVNGASELDNKNTQESRPVPVLNEEFLMECRKAQKDREPYEETYVTFASENSTFSCEENAKILSKVEELREEIRNTSGVDKSTMCQRMTLAVEGLTNYLVSDKSAQSRFAENPSKDCNDIQRMGFKENGIYTILPHDCGPPIQVYCDLETRGGGWTVIQRREDGSVGFYRGYGNYRRGFGNLAGEFWLGNQNMHRITDQDEYELLVELWDFNDTKAEARYDGFYIGSQHSKFRLNLGQFIGGDAGDSLTYHDGNPFSTKDRDNDMLDFHCALAYGGGWWYQRCHFANLNGFYLHGETELFGKGINWFDFRGLNYSLKKTEMKIRIKD